MNAMQDTAGVATPEGFEAYFEAEIAPDLQAMESRRKTGATLFILLLCMAVLGGAGFFLADQIVAATGMRRNLVMVVSLLMVAGGIGGGVLIYRRVHGAFKEVLVGRTCAFMGMTFESKGFGFPLGRFMDAELLPRHDKSHLEDRISGEHNGVSFELCEARLDRIRRETDSDGDSKEEQSIVFRGMLLRYSFAKPFKGRTLVGPDATWLGNKLVGISKRGERVTLEDVRFEREFEVYSTDQIEARYLLTPRFMERLLDLANQFGNRKGLCVAVADSDLLIAVRSDVNRFEGGSIFSSFTDMSRAYSLIQELSLIEMIIEVLNLEDRSGA